MKTPYEMGVAAYTKGIMAPCLDPDFMPLMAGLPVGDQAIGMLKEWNRGWTDAHLAATVFSWDWETAAKAVKPAR